MKAASDESHLIMNLSQVHLNEGCVLTIVVGQSSRGQTPSQNLDRLMRFSQGRGIILVKILTEYWKRHSQPLPNNHLFFVVRV